MFFEQLASIIPVFQRIQIFHQTQLLQLEEEQHALVVMRSGLLTIGKGGGEEAVVVSQGYACHPGEGPYSLQVPRTKEAEYFVIFYRLLPAGAGWSLQGPLYTLSEVKIKYMLDELLRMAEGNYSFAEREEPAQRFRMRLMLERILFIYLYETDLREQEASRLDGIDESLAYMKEHYMLKLTLPLLAGRAGMSEGHYTVRFKSRTGLTMTQYLRRLRVEKAKELFLQTSLSAKEIAQRVGYSDYFHFSRVFKQEEGCSPTSFQEKQVKI
ncbi:AraC family transcriptional regulator [Paenibacillus sp. HB172176]|uniref:AraC family transcriptional regulator n=1 Tax=Paenibacillus sp. HB172176 TaxID=2493690 RepID=UPI00143B6E62|nr:AraC family transcriptional regulator [Paenibacillus sp. HB172176]